MTEMTDGKGLTPRTLGDAEAGIDDDQHSVGPPHPLWQLEDLSVAWNSEHTTGLL